MTPDERDRLEAVAYRPGTLDPIPWPWEAEAARRLLEREDEAAEAADTEEAA